MSKHKTTIVGYDGTLQELAQAIANLRYDARSMLFKHLEDEYAKLGQIDANTGKPKLAIYQEKAQLALSIVTELDKRSWIMSIPYMKDDIAETPDLFSDKNHG